MSSLSPQSVPPRCDSPRTPATTSRGDATRPFTASAARSGNLLTVHVHHGEHLDALLVHGADGGEDAATSSFVVLSVGAFASEAQRAECLSHAVSIATSGASEGSEPTLYAQHYSPFTATRVVESNNAPAWNELLALSLPLEWREHPGALWFALKVELVQRGASQQEDFLLATAVVPLASLQCHARQVRLALQFPVAATHAAAAPRIYVSLRETARDCFNFSAQAADRLEVLVQRFVHLGATVAATEEEKAGIPKPNSLAFRLAISPSSGLKDDMTHLFTVLQDQNQIPTEDALTDCGLTPSSVIKRSSAAGAAGPLESFQWHFPLVFELQDAGVDDENGSDVDTRVVEIALYDTSDVHRQVRIGTAAFPLNQFLNSGRNGASVALNPPVPIYSVSQLDNGVVSSQDRVLLGHLHATVRWWSAAAWGVFLRDTPSRRVVSSNRNIRKRHALLGLEWMGALLRGLNRYPVSSFCDEGGLSSVLADFLAASSSSEAATKRGGGPAVSANGMATNANGPGGLNAEMSALLISQVTHLQAESAAQRQQIERLQTELDARLKAVQTCGKELVALHRELRLKDQRIEEMKAELEKVSSRERLQMEQLMTAAAAPYSSGAADSRVHQQLTLVLTKYKDLEQQHQETKAELDAAKRALELYQDLETRHAELEQAHLVQAAQVQRLQREKQHVTELKRAVRLQEKVIRQFEDAVSLESAEELAKRTAPVLSHGSSTTNTISSAALGKHLPPAAAHSAQEAGDSSCNDALLAVRVRVLEEQLTVNARDAASEIGRLRMRILELEMSGHRAS